MKVLSAYRGFPPPSGSFCRFRKWLNAIALHNLLCVADSMSSTHFCTSFWSRCSLAVLLFRFRYMNSHITRSLSVRPLSTIREMLLLGGGLSSQRLDKVRDTR